MDHRNAEAAILAQERRALDRWSNGDPGGYAQSAADDVTYFDDIGAHHRVDGLQALRDYLSGLDGQIPAHTYELVRPKIQVYGDVGILTLRYHPTSLDGEALTSWKATAVYRRIGEAWQLVHAHWSVVKDA
jgi:ketosteroid isomerase-like protein